MSFLTLKDLPPPPAGKTGWPWTQEAITPPRPLADYPRISIVTPTYGQGDYIEETIRSVLLQGYPNLDYRINDGGSTDQTVEIIQKYAPFLSGWLSEKDKGQCDAINKGLKTADGQLFNWLNSDDFYFPDTLQRVAHYFMDRPETEVVGGRSRVFNGDKELYIYRGVYVGPDLTTSVGKLDIGQPETFFRMDVMRQLSPLTVNLHYGMDAEMWLKYLLKFGLKNLKKTDDIFVNYRYHDTSKSSAQAPRFFFDRAAIFCSIAGKLGRADFVEAVSSLIPAKLKGNYEFQDAFDPQLFEAALPYYWLYFANVYYETYDFKRCQACLRPIDPAKLLPEDQKLYALLKSRSGFLPPFVVKWIRRITR